MRSVGLTLVAALTGVFLLLVWPTRESSDDETKRSAPASPERHTEQQLSRPSSESSVPDVLREDLLNTESGQTNAGSEKLAETLSLRIWIAAQFADDFVVTVRGELSDSPLQLARIGERAWFTNALSRNEGTIRVDLTGTRCVPETVLIRTDKSTQEAHHTFRPSLGVPLDAIIRDELGRLIVDATITASWEHDSRTTTSSVPVSASGSCHFASLPPQPVHFRLTKDGFSAKAIGPVVLPATESPLNLVFSRSGTLRGTVRYLDRPVEDFSIVYWYANSTVWTQVDFESSQGSFSLEDIPDGLLNLFASTEASPMSEPTSIEIRCGQTSSVAIDMPSALIGSGVVIDARNGSPVFGARVETWTFGAARTRNKVGIAQVTDSAGAFAGVALSPFGTVIGASADGYAPTYVSATGTRNNLGVIGLFPTQPLSLRIQSTNAQDLQEFWAVSGSRSELYRQAFSSEGFVQWPSVSPSGKVVVEIHPPWDGRVDAWLPTRAGTNWAYQVLVDTGRTVTMHVRTGRELQQALTWVEVVYETAEGVTINCFRPLSTRREAVFGEIPRTQVTLNLYENGEVILTAWKDMRFEGDVAIELLLVDVDLQVLFLDENGDPLPFLHLLVAPKGPWPLSPERTDESGICKLHISGEDQLELYAQSPDKTLFWHGTTRLDDAFVEVTVAPRCTTTIRFFERGSPAIGIRAHLRHCASGLPVRSMTTDEGGCGGSYRLSSGEYELAVDQPGYWPQMIVVGPDVPTQWDVQVRRTASLELTLSNTSLGVAVQPGVELVYEESGESVADWLAADRAQGSLAPDTAGVMRVDSVPNGRYRYRVLAGDVVLASGHLDLAPHDLTRKTVPY